MNFGGYTSIQSIDDLKIAPHRWRPKKEADHFRLLGGSFNKQRKLHIRLALESCKMTMSHTYPPEYSLKVYIEALNGFSHIYSLESLNNTLFTQAAFLKNSFHRGNRRVERIFQGQGKR